jgi:hypothetical protein
MMILWTLINHFIACEQDLFRQWSIPGLHALALVHSNEGRLQSGYATRQQQPATKFKLTILYSYATSK